MSLFGIMITWPCLAYISSHEGTDAIAVIASCFCGGFFCFLVYDVFFQRGAADATKKERGLIDPSPFTGLAVAAVAYIPTFVFIVAANIFYAANIENGYGFCSVVVNMVIHAMYSGFIWFFNGTHSYLQPLLMFVTLVPTLFHAHSDIIWGFRKGRFALFWALSQDRTHGIKNDRSHIHS